MARVSDAHLEARRQSILVAATKVFSQKGIAAATMAEIASEAGISPGAIYRYFENKEQLAKGCMTESAETIKRAWTNPASSELSFTELARLTFAEIDLPGEEVATQMFLEQVLTALREHDPAHLADLREEHERLQSGIRFLMEREFGEGLQGRDVAAIGEALYAFYWGARLLKLIVPGSNPAAQLVEVQKLLNAVLPRQDA